MKLLYKKMSFKNNTVFRLASAQIFILFLGLLFAFSQCGNKNNLPKGDPDNGGLFLPDGFEALVVVDSLEGRARHIAVNDNDDIYVKLRFPDSIGGNLAIRVNEFGKADSMVKFNNYDDKGSYGTAMRIYNGYIYFSSELNVFRQKLNPETLVPDGEFELILRDDHEHGRHEHIAKPVTFDTEGNMYVAFGANSNGCQIQNRTPQSPGIYPCPLLEDHGGIWKFDANKLDQTQKDGSLFATGLRSVVGMEWNPIDSSLYVLQHGRDDLLRLWPDLYSPWQSAMFPSEQFLRMKEGDNAGWPYFYYDQMQGKRVINPEYLGYAAELGDGSQFVKPLIGFPGHWAPNDIFFYTGDQFPERYKKGAFIAFHGSTNRAPYPQSGYFIAFVPFNNGAYDNWEIFADGFSGLDTIMNVRDAVYRPMGLSMGKDGSVYISDTEKGKIWRTMYKGNKKKFGTEQLAGMEKRKSLSHIATPDEEKDNLDKGMVFGGEKVYKIYCGTCHQGDGKGDGARFPPLDQSEWVIGRDKRKLIDVILNGLEGPIEVKGKPYNSIMPQHSFLSDDDVAKVLTYIRKSFGNSADAVSPHEVARVRAGKR